MVGFRDGRAVFDVSVVSGVSDGFSGGLGGGVLSVVLPDGSGGVDWGCPVLFFSDTGLELVFCDVGGGLVRPFVRDVWNVLAGNVAGFGTFELRPYYGDGTPLIDGDGNPIVHSFGVLDYRVGYYGVHLPLNADDFADIEYVTLSFVGGDGERIEKDIQVHLDDEYPFSVEHTEALEELLDIISDDDKGLGYCDKNEEFWVSGYGVVSIEPTSIDVYGEGFGYIDDYILHFDKNYIGEYDPENYRLYFTFARGTLTANTQIITTKRGTPTRYSEIFPYTVNSSEEVIQTREHNYTTNFIIFPFQDVTQDGTIRFSFGEARYAHETGFYTVQLPEEVLKEIKYTPNINYLEQTYNLPQINNDSESSAVVMLQGDCLVRQPDSSLIYFYDNNTACVYYYDEGEWNELLVPFPLFDEKTFSFEMRFDPPEGGVFLNISNITSDENRDNFIIYQGTDYDEYIVKDFFEALYYYYILPQFDDTNLNYNKLYEITVELDSIIPYPEQEEQ